MALARVTLTSYIQSQADWRATGAAISAQLAAGGLVKTADTGQVDWTATTAWTSTAVVPAVTTYEIWRFADSLQSAAPVYFRIEYSTYYYTTPAATMQGMRLRFTIGTGSNGAGSILGTNLAIVDHYEMNSNTNPGQEYIFNCTPSRLFLAKGITVNSQAPLLAYFERPLDSTATIQPDGLICAFVGGATVAQFFMYGFGMSIPTVANTLPFPGSTVSGHIVKKGADVSCLLPIYYLGKAFYSAMFLALPLNAVLTGSVYQVSVLGQMRNYLQTAYDGTTSSYYYWYYFSGQNHLAVLMD